MLAQTVTIDGRGRIVLPKQALDALGLKPEDKVIIEVSEASLVIKPKPATASPDILDDWSHEGLDDPEGDEVLAQEALAMLEDIEAGRVTLIPWEQIEAELDSVEASSELHRSERAAKPEVDLSYIDDSINPEQNCKNKETPGSVNGFQ